MNNKAFTLIELLTILIVLGLIATITIPKIKDTLEDSKKNVAKISAQSYKKAIDEYILHEKMNGQRIILDEGYNITTNGYLENLTDTLEIEFSGDKPKGGYMIYDDGELQSACITINKFKITFTNEEITNIQKGTCETLAQVNS